MASLQIPISKGKDLFFEVDPNECMGEDFPTDVLKEILFQGYKQVLNRGMSKQLSSKGLSGTKLEQNNAMLYAIAEKTMEAMRKGEIRVTGGKTKRKGLEKEYRTEAMRICRLAVKDAIKEGGEKVSHYKAKDITDLAEQLLASEQGDEFVAQARENVDARKAKEKAFHIDVSKIKPDAGLVAKAKKKADEAKQAAAARKAGVKGGHRGEARA